jgi:hypothetical protein
MATREERTNAAQATWTALRKEKGRVARRRKWVGRGRSLGADEVVSSL